MAITADDERWMARAIQLAEKGRYTTKPNPCVGCVITKDNRLIAEGWHYRAGEEHAEIMALNSASESLVGATVYVTLEPCNHQGRTGPCTQALVHANIGRLVFGMVDPNPKVSGQGLKTIAKAGVGVDGPVLEKQAQALNTGFIHRMKTGLPYVRCKVATSLDGRVAMSSGESQWITGAAARQDVQKWRARSGAVVTGIGSILQDNSRLNLRAEELFLENKNDVISRPPLRVVMDSQLQISNDANIFKSGGQTLILTASTTADTQSSRFNELNAISDVNVIAIREDKDGRLDLINVLTTLASQFECNDILLEAGPRLVGSFLKAGLINEWIVYQAPIFLGAKAKPLSDWSIELMKEKLSFQMVDQRNVGADQRIILRPA